MGRGVLHNSFTASISLGGERTGAAHTRARPHSSHEPHWTERLKLDPCDEHLRVTYKFQRKVFSGYEKVVAVERRRGGKAISLARLIMQPPAGFVVDHINRDTMDNRRSNLRVCTIGQNAFNRAKITGNYKGASPYIGGKWIAKIGANYRKLVLGVFDTEEDAARAYDEAAIALHGDFASLNFPERVGG